MEVKAIGSTFKNKDGEISLILVDEMPADCVVIFINKEDWKEAKYMLGVQDGIYKTRNG